jgi:hypothetical protein
MNPARRLTSASWVAAALLLGGCTIMRKPPPAPPPPVVEVAEQPVWYSTASGEDIQRLERIDEAWRQALTEARSKGFVKAVEQEGVLLRPNAALPRPAPTPGPYRCKVIKLGTIKGRGTPFNAYKPFACYVEVENELLTIVKQTGSQRPAGRLYQDLKESRLIFLGTLALGTEEAPLPYGERADRDMAGVLERIGPFRFRLVVPFPRVESKLDVIELVPVVETDIERPGGS